MVETRNRRKSLAAGQAIEATPAPASIRRRTTAADAEPSSSGRQADEQQHVGSSPAAALQPDVNYADMYRQAALRAKQAEQSNIFRRLRSRLWLFYHQQAMTWGLYMLDPWETTLVLATLLFFCWLVVSACLFNPSSICSSMLAATRRTLAAQGAKLLSLGR